MTAVQSKPSSRRSIRAKWYVPPADCLRASNKHLYPQIIVHASPAATDHLLESCARIRAMTTDIYAPLAGEGIQIGQYTNSFSISLSDELLASLQISKVKNSIPQLDSQVADACPLTSSRTTK